MSRYTHNILRSMTFLFIIHFSTNSILLAESRNDPGNKSTFLFYIENDAFGRTDEHYTAALKLTWISRDLRADGNGLPGWSAWLTDKTPGINRNDFLHNLSLSLGQSIYTPQDIESEELIVDDRPYAGWAYLSLGLHSQNFNMLNSLELNLGIVGPSSLAEETQTTVHEWINNQEPRGWDNQLKDEPGLQLSWQRYWRFARSPICVGFAGDVIPHVGFTLGNVFTYVNTGFEARIGYNLPTDFGTSLIGPGGVTVAPTSICDPRLNSGSFGISFFAGADGRAIARNIFLDGNTFKDSHSIEKKNFVADLYGGISIVYGRFKLTYTHVYRTEEFEAQKGGQYFGSLNFAWTF